MSLISLLYNSRHMKITNLQKRSAVSWVIFILTLVVGMSMGLHKKDRTSTSAVQTDTSEVTVNPEGQPYIKFRADLLAKGWTPVIPALYEQGLDSMTKPISVGHPEIASCGSGRTAVCTAQFKKGSEMKNLNIHNIMSSYDQPDTWIVFVSE